MTYTANMSKSRSTKTRSRSAPATRAAILAAARARFAAEGYERTTLRAVAGDVGVDAAMVIRYFGSKEALFAEAADFELRLPDLTGVRPEDFAEVLLPRFFAVWEEDATFLALLRASATSPRAAAKMREVFATQVAPSLAAALPDHPMERVGLLGTLMMGLVVERYVLVNPAVADMDQEEVTAWIAPLMHQALFGPAPMASPNTEGDH